VYYSDAFGTPTFKDTSGTTLVGTSTGTRFLFTGREWFAALNLYDYRNRTYSAELGRFIETDPIRFKAEDVNLYRYVGNNSVNLVDPAGMCPALVAIPLGQYMFSVTATGYITYQLYKIISYIKQDGCCVKSESAEWREEKKVTCKVTKVVRLPGQFGNAICTLSCSDGSTKTVICDEGSQVGDQENPDWPTLD
jgi:hypothetical protein